MSNQMNEFPDPCAVIAIVTCEGNEECEYSVSFTGMNSHILLKDKLSEQGYLDFQSIVYYKINIVDPLIKEVDLLITAVTGSIDVSYSLNTKFPVFQNSTSANTDAPKHLSTVQSTIPDFIKIQRKSEKPIGNIYIGLKANTISSYNIVYRGIKENSNVVDDMLFLKNGVIMKDYIDLTKQQTLKFYKYKASQVSSNSPAEDIRITLTTEKNDFELYAFIGNYRDYGYNNKTGEVKGYTWKCNYNNEILISKSDSNYKLFDDYYILVIHKPNILRSNKTDYQHTGSYYLVATTESIPIILHEGFPHSATLNNKLFFNQQYYYKHYNTSLPCKIDLNAFDGSLDVYLSFDKEFKVVPISKINIDSTVITLTPEYVKDYCNDKSCDIFVKVFQANKAMEDKRSINTKYSIVLQTSKAIFIENGVINKPDNVFKGLQNYYYTYSDKTNHTLISALFSSGSGKIYVKIVNSDDTLTQYPSSTDYDLRSNTIYLGEGLSIKKDLMDKLCKSTLCKILITIDGTHSWSLDKNINYQLSVSSKDKKLYQNKPFRGWIEKNEMQYFTIFLDDPIKSISVSLTNLDGDADLLMSYGKDNYPNFNTADWASTNIQSEFIELDLDSSYYKEKKINSMSGWYTIGVYGISNTTYTIDVSTHPYRVKNLNDYSPSACKRDIGGDKDNSSQYCNFRFSDFYINSDDKTSTYDFVISTQYLYGSGIIYAKLADLGDFKNYDYFDALPKANSYEFSSINKQRNQLYISIPSSDPRLAASRKSDPILLVSVHCLEKCFFSLTVGSKIIDRTLRYVDKNRDNLIYMKKNSNITLMYLDNLVNNIDYKLHLVKGKAEFGVYSGTIGKNVKLDENNETRYHTKIINNSSSLVYTMVRSFEEDVAFYVNMSYDDQWNKLQVNSKSFRYTLNNNTNQFLGFFHMHSTYESVLLSAKATRVCSKAIIKLYARYLILDKKNKIDEVLEANYNIPNEENAEIIETFEKKLNTLSYRIPGAAKEIKDDQSVIILLRVDFQYLPDNSTIKNNTDFKDNNDSNIIDQHKDDSDTILEINLQAQDNDMKYHKIDLESEYPFMGKIVDTKSIQVYDLKKVKPNDDLIIVEISPCNSDLAFWVSDSIDPYNGKEVGRETMIEYVNGRYYTKIKPIQENQYLSIKSTKELNDTIDEQNCKWNIGTPIRESFIEWDKVGKDIQISWQPVIQYDTKDETSDIIESVKYYVFISYEDSDFDKMQSVCSLARVKDIDFDETLANVYMITPKETEDHQILYVNVLAVIPGQRDALAYIPIKVLMPKLDNTLSTGMVITVILISVFTIILLIAAFCYYRKYKLYQSQVEYEQTDMRNLATLTMTDTELSEVRKKLDKAKYSTLTEDVSKV